MTSSQCVEGAASAAPSIAIPENATLAEIDEMEDAAVDAIESVRSPEEAELLLRKVTAADHAVRLAKISSEREQRWGRLRLLAERRYGELLGPAEHGGARASVKVTLADDDRNARKRARKVAAVPQADFDEYVTTESRPTRSGLLRKTAAPRPRPGAGKLRSQDEAPERLRERLEAIRFASAGGYVGGRLPRWSPQDVADVETVLANPPKRQPKYAGKRRRQLAALRREGFEVPGYHDAIVQFIGVLEAIDPVAFAAADPEHVQRFFDDLFPMKEWVDRAIDYASGRLDDAAFERKISMLRETNGRTEAEQRNFAAAADRLERRRRRNRLAS